MILNFIKKDLCGDIKWDLLKRLLINVLDDKIVNNLPTNLKWYNETLKISRKLKQEQLIHNLNIYKIVLEKQKSDMTHFFKNIHLSHQYNNIYSLKKFLKNIMDQKYYGPNAKYTNLQIIIEVIFIE
jgi:hypothetical protein